MSRRFSAIIFDLDGTLIHSVPDLAWAVNALLAEEGREPLTEADVGPMVGNGVAVLVERAFTARGGMPQGDPAELVRRFVAHYEPNATRLTRPFEGVVETLKVLKAKGLTLAICTNKVSSATREILRALDLEQYFAVVVGGDDTPVHKPDPAHVNLVLDRLGVHHDDAVYVGDSINDVLAAKGAHVRCILVSFGYTKVPARDLGADLVIDSFADLIEAVGAGR
ncbi:phosphoglycolate phosphatase [Magnetospirillum sp. UT-4]|uniref:phosphoglycolate phosphatase n=1 Tax=Magnetospirillum sp. UT-4 TaxID=2681467 RepID=UPI001380452F|nr:phosphoglycolate phosphatase [Magnetospirillum sp. UT-4]CAA7620271.1 Phosphoglycolate phosphatase [Magnetospirillum sp. UT-4]